MGNRVNKVLYAIEKNLDDERQYSSAYEVEVAAGLVEQAEIRKPYNQNSTHNQISGDESKPGSYSGRERIKPASSRDVSPNTPTGEQV